MLNIKKTKLDMNDLNKSNQQFEGNENDRKSGKKDLYFSQDQKQAKDKKKQQDIQKNMIIFQGQNPQLSQFIEDQLSPLNDVDSNDSQNDSDINKSIKFQDEESETPGVKQQGSDSGSIWKGKLEDQDSKGQFQYIYEFNEKRDNKRRRTPNITEIDDGPSFDRKLMQMAKQYHKNLVKEVMERQKIKQEEGIKEEHEQVLINENLSRFPFDEFKDRKFNSIDELRWQLKQQENKIVNQIADFNQKIIFYDSYEEIVKKTETKLFINFKCKINNCQAIMKVSVQKDQCVVYLFRNKHNHNLKGDIIHGNQYEKGKLIETINLDDDLHAMFGLHKGVRTETRNQKYLDPQEKKVVRQQQREANKDKPKNKKKSKKKKHKDVHREQNGVLHLNDSSSSQSQKKIMLRKPSKNKNKKNRIKKRQNSKIRESYPEKRKIQEEEFQDIIKELQNRKLKVEYFDNFEKYQKTSDYKNDKKKRKELFPKIILMISSEMIESYKLYGDVVKFELIQHFITLSQQKYVDEFDWSLGVFSGFNSNLSPIVFAITIIKGEFHSQKCIQKVFRSFLRMICREPIAFITCCNEIFISALEQLTQNGEYTGMRLVDQYQVMKKIQNISKQPIYLKKIKKLLTSKINNEVDEIINFFKTKQESQILQIYQCYKNLALYCNLPQKFLGLSMNLNSAKNISYFLKQKMKNTANKNTLKNYLDRILQLSRIIDHNSRTALHNENFFIIEKIYKDQDLGMVRKNVGSRVLIEFIQNYVEALDIEFQKCKKEGYKFEKGKVIVSNNLQCSCKYKQYVGLPCKHIIKILKFVGKTYLSQINKRWIIKQKKKSIQLYDQNTQKRSSKRLQLLKQEVKFEYKQGKEPNTIKLQAKLQENQ